VTVDPTDLLTLPALLISWHLLTRSATTPKPRSLPRPVSRAVFALSMLLCAANQPNCPDCGTENPWQVDAANADGDNFAGGFYENTYVIGNTTADVLVLRVRELEKISVDCQQVAAQPTAILSRKLFAPAKAWIVEPNRVLPLEAVGVASGACRVYLIDAAGLPARVIVIDGDSV